MSDASSTKAFEAVQAVREYTELCHAMQSGVAFEQSRGSQDGTPKHLRVGINVAMCDHAALVKLLVEKGIITDEEYAKAIRDEMRAEVDRYEERNGVKFA